MGGVPKKEKDGKIPKSKFGNFENLGEVLIFLKSKLLKLMKMVWSSFKWFQGHQIIQIDKKNSVVNCFKIQKPENGTFKIIQIF